MQDELASNNNAKTMNKDIMADYLQNIVKRYKYWTVYVHTNQGYLGRCAIWCNRKNAYDLIDASEDELREFSKIIKGLKFAIEKSFKSDWMNYSFLGNSDKHLHCHMVPRYQDEKVFNNQIFKDTKYKKGLNWLLDKSFVTSEELLQSVKEKIQKNLVI